MCIRDSLYTVVAPCKLESSVTVKSSIKELGFIFCNSDTGIAIYGSNTSSNSAEIVALPE